MLKPAYASLILRYGAAMLADGIAGLVALLLRPQIERALSAPFFAAVMVAAYYGGLGPGLLATGIAILIIEYFFSPPFFTIALSVEDFVRMSVFAFVAVLISALNAARKEAEESLRMAQRDLEQRVQERTAELAHAKTALEAEVEERALAQETLQRLASIVESSDDAIIGLTVEGTIVSWNPAAERMYGYSAEEAVGRSVAVIVPSERREELWAILDGLGRGKAAEHLETVRIRKDGARIDVSVTLSAIRDRTGKLTGASSVARDISARKRVEQQLRLQDAALRAAANGIVIADRDGTILWVNPAFTALTGYPAAEALGHTPRILKSGKQDASFYEELWRTILAGQVWRGETINRRKDGSLYTEEQTITPILGEDGRVTRFVAVKQDVTERKQLQEELIQAEKLGALGELSAGIAHELNNPLAVMMGHAQLLRMGELDPKVASRVERIVDAAQRATRIVKNFLTAARRHPPEKVAVSINQVITDTLELVAYQLRVGNIEAETSLSSEVPSIAGDPHQLRQMMLNLVNNATQAMVGARGRGRLRVRTDRSGDGRSIRILVADDGPGIAPEHQTRIFEPFFTTKPLGEGTGLGLAVVEAIVKDHGGSIGVESVPGEGATFIVDLPVTTPPSTPPGTMRARAIPAGLRVLVVDDEEPLRELVAEALAMRGVRVETAADGQEALELLGRVHVDVVILDVHMPGMPGTEVWERLNNTNPALARRSIFCTGSVVRESTRSFIGKTGCPYVAKPFEWAEVFDAIATALARSAT